MQKSLVSLPHFFPLHIAWLIENIEKDDATLTLVSATEKALQLHDTNFTY